MTTKSRMLLLVSAAFGLAAASASSVVHYRLLTNPGYTSFCDVNATVSCTQAYLSQYGSLFGVPVAIFGVLFFLLVLLLVGLGGRQASSVRDSVPAYVFALSTVALAFSLYLAWASYIQLKTFCMLCAATYAAVIALFIISGGASTVPMTTLPRRAPRDVRHLFSSPLALVLALLYLVGAGTVIAYFPGEPVRAQAAAPMTALTDQQHAELIKWWDLQPRVDMSNPAPGAKVVVVGFSDFQCPHCRSAHETYRGLIAKYAGNSQVRFIARHFPLEGECNPNAPGGNHMAACEAAAAVVMARQTGKAAAMEDWLYENQITLTPSSVREAAKSVGGIGDFNGGYAKALEEVKEDARMGGLLGVTSTPTFFLNGRKLPAGVVPPEYIDALITVELQRAK
ncbi:MAG: vitamin K epoxide reductase family protein [Acidobacteriota bacterium]